MAGAVPTPDTSAVHVACLENLRQAIRAAAWYNERWIGAEGQLSQVTAILGAARDTLLYQQQTVAALVTVINHARQPKAYHWAIGALWLPGQVVPVGGFLERDLGPVRLHLDVTGDESPRARIGLAARF